MPAQPCEDRTVGLMLRPTVLLLCTQSSGQPYLEPLKAAGFEPTVRDVISYRFINAGAMIKALGQREAYDGLVVTSPRTTQAWRRESRAASLLKNWTDAPAYCVGPRTASEARDLGLKPVRQHAGSAAELGYVIAEQESSRPLLFCTGSPRRPELPERLAAAGVPIREVVVYESTVDRAPPVGVVPDWVVFFSPRVMSAALEWDWPWSEICVGAVGTTTGRRAKERGIVSAAAPYHAADALVCAMADNDGT